MRKICNKCGKIKPLKAFEKKTGSKMGVVCQDCKKQTFKTWQEERRKDRSWINLIIG